MTTRRKPASVKEIRTMIINHFKRKREEVIQPQCGLHGVESLKVPRHHYRGSVFPFSYKEWVSSPGLVVSIDLTSLSGIGKAHL